MATPPLVKVTLNNERVALFVSSQLFKQAKINSAGADNIDDLIPSLERSLGVSVQHYDIGGSGNQRIELKDVKQRLFRDVLSAREQSGIEERDLYLQDDTGLFGSNALEQELGGYAKSLDGKLANIVVNFADLNRSKSDGLGFNVSLAGFCVSTMSILVNDYAQGRQACLGRIIEHCPPDTAAQVLETASSVGIIAGSATAAIPLAVNAMVSGHRTLVRKSLMYREADHERITQKMVNAMNAHESNAHTLEPGVIAALYDRVKISYPTDSEDMLDAFLAEADMTVKKQREAEANIQQEYKSQQRGA